MLGGTMALTHTAVSNAKPKEKPYKLSDAGGLYLQIKPSGYKAWKYDFRLSSKRGTYTIGNYPDISLQEARELHRDARSYVAKGINPKLIKEEQRIKADLDDKRFSHYANDWLNRRNIAESTYKDLSQRIKTNLIPYLDRKRVDEYSTLDLLKVMQKITDKGALETAQRMANVTRRVYNDILTLGIVENNPAQGLADLLRKPDASNKGNFAHITSPDEIAVLLRLIDEPSSGQDFATTQALKLMPLVFLRPKNIRFLKWDYVDFNERLINFPAQELKTRTPLVVPLAKQAIDILKAIKPLTGNGEYVFVTSGSKGKPLSEATTTQALKRLIDPKTGKPFGTGHMTSHGFRHMASTQLNELGYDPDAIELQLAHVNRDRVRATYNKAQLMDKRIEMMQGWADYLDQLKNGSTIVVAINRKLK